MVFVTNAKPPGSCGTFSLGSEMINQIVIANGCLVRLKCLWINELPNMEFEDWSVFIKSYPLFSNLHVSEEMYLNFCNEFLSVCFEVFLVLSCYTLYIQEGPKKILLFNLIMKILCLRAEPMRIFEHCVCRCTGSCLQVLPVMHMEPRKTLPTLVFLIRKYFVDLPVEGLLIYIYI